MNETLEIILVGVGLFVSVLIVTFRFRIWDYIVNDLLFKRNRKSTERSGTTWNEINDEHDAQRFMTAVGEFHDSCIKEMHYVSGAYVNQNRAMHPVNDRRALRVVVQRQSQDNAVIEMEFQGVKHLNLMPADDAYTCEILDSTLRFGDNGIYWCDCGGVVDFDQYEGAMVCATALRWRVLEHSLGEQELYRL